MGKRRGSKNNECTRTAIDSAYRGIHFSRIHSSKPSIQPATPHSFFDSTHDVICDNDSAYKNIIVSKKDVGLHEDAETKRLSVKAIECKFNLKDGNNESSSANKNISGYDKDVSKGEGQETNGISKDEIEEKNDSDIPTERTECEKEIKNQIVHRHPNGLCVITAGKCFVSDCSQSESSVRQVYFMHNRSSTENNKKDVASKKRKKNDKSVNNKNSTTVKPNDEIARVKFCDGTVCVARSYVHGKLVEINEVSLKNP